jgi:RNA polymerase sigma-70 factor (family 1)
MEKDISIDCVILLGLNKGDKVAFSKVFKNYHRLLYALAFRYLKSEDAAMDAVQNVFMVLWEKRESLNFDTNLRSLLFTILKNYVLNEIRHNKIVYEKQYEISQLESNKEIDISDAIENKEMKTLLYTSIQKLPFQERKVCLLKIVNGMTNQEIAERLNITIPTVKSHYTQAIKKLRNEIGGFTLVSIICMLNNLIK